LVVLLLLLPLLLRRAHVNPLYLLQIDRGQVLVLVHWVFRFFFFRERGGRAGRPFRTRNTLLQRARARIDRRSSR
jgi:hypothetical protein